MNTQKTTLKHEFHQDPVMVQTYQGHRDTITALSFHPTMFLSTFFYLNFFKGGK